MKTKISTGDTLMDDCNILYKVVDVLPNSVVVQTIDKGIQQHFACEIVTNECIEAEGWKVVIIKQIKK